ncbi:acyl carrier protein 1, chloroplastic-like [Capsicum annuum]
MLLLYPKSCQFVYYFFFNLQFGSKVAGLRLVPSFQISRAATKTPKLSHSFKNQISCSIVEIMMALEEKFGVSIGEEGAQNIATVQDAADLIEKVKAA